METNTSVGESIKCYVRCRPLNAKELDLGACCIKINDRSDMISIDNKTESVSAGTKVSFTISQFTLKSDWSCPRTDSKSVPEAVIGPMIREFPESSKRFLKNIPIKK